MTLPFIGGTATENRYLGYIFGFASPYLQNDYIPAALTSITLLESCTSIPENAFRTCSNISTVILPDNLQSIGAYAFAYCDSLIIDLPDGLLEIGNNAFTGCLSFIEVIIPESVASIGRGAFADCDNMTKITLPFVGGSLTANQYLGYIFGAYNVEQSNSYVPEALKEIIVSEPCTKISSQAFAYLENITKISLPASLSLIEDRAIYGCMNLETIEIAEDNLHYTVDGNILFSKDLSVLLYVLSGAALQDYIISGTVTEIRGYAFYDCRDLRTIYIPNSVQTIRAMAFYNNDNNTTIVCQANTPPVTWYSGWDYSIATIYWGFEAVGYHQDFSYLLVDNAITIINSSRASEVISIPDTIDGYPVTKIGIRAFYYSQALNIRLPESLLEIGNYAFFNSQIATISLPSGLLTIGDYAFYQCLNLEELTIPASVIHIGNSAFRNSTNLMLNISHQIPEIALYAFDGTAFLNSLKDANGFAIINKQLLRYLGTDTHVVVPHDVEMIARGAFSTGNIVSLSLPFVGGSPTTNTHIGYIFGASAASLHDSFLPPALKEVIIQEGCREIGWSAFKFCSYITDIIIPASVEMIANDAFAYCDGLVNLTIPFVGESPSYNRSLAQIFGAPEYSNTWFVPKSLKKVTILGTCPDIADYAFFRLEHITDVIIESGVTTIGSYAFYECLSLVNVTIPGSVTTIGGFAFDGTPWINNAQDENGLVIVNDILICSLFTGAHLVIPGSVKKVVFAALYGNDNLISISIPFTGASANSNEHFGFIFGDDLNNIYCTPESLSRIIIQPGSTLIKSKAFANISSLSEVILPDSITSIEDYAFMNCIGLESFHLPNNLQYLGKGAFQGCIGLSSINLPDALTEIGDNAFTDCTALTDIEFPEGLRSIGASAFANTALTEVYIPIDVISIGQSAFYQCNLETISIPFVGGSADANRHFGYIFGAQTPYANVFFVPETLRHVKILFGCTSIAARAFDGCYYLLSVTIPATVMVMGESVFDLCYNLVILCEEDVQPFGWAEDWNSECPFYFGFGDELQEYQDLFYLIDYNKIIIVNAKKDISTLVVPSQIAGYDVVKIGKKAFANCESLTRVTISGLVREIGDQAFYACPALTEVAIGNGVRSIGKSIFLYCWSIQTLTLPFIGDSVESDRTIGYFFGSPGYYDNHSYYVPESLETVRILEGCLRIGNDAFRECKYIKNIHLPNSLQSIGNYAFYMCSQLQGIIVPRNVKSIGSCAFNSCLNLRSIELPDGLETISDNVFYNSPLTSVFIPASVTYISYYAFQYIEGLTIYVEAESQPEAWHPYWNESNTVVWGATRP
jgi:hypothetical protein